MNTLLRDQDRADLSARLTRLTPEAERHWGTMTPHQMLCHIGDQMRVALGDAPARRRGTLLHRTLLKWLILYFPIPTPKGRIQTVQEMKTTQPTAWADDLEAVRALLERMATTTTPAPHPVFGAMSRQQWGRLGWKHIDYHLQQFGV
jgi:hypothetical protein